MSGIRLHFSLPLPEGQLELPLTLALVDLMEQKAGSLYALAENLLQGKQPLGDILRLLEAVYRHAGCPLEEPALQAFLMTQQPAGLLIRLLGAVLTPLSSVDIALEAQQHAGEPGPACAGSICRG